MVMKKENEIQEERASNYLNCQKWGEVDQVILSVGSIFQLRYSGAETLRWRAQPPTPPSIRIMKKQMSEIQQEKEQVRW